MQDQLRQAKESVSNMQKLHELAQSQMFELRAQSGEMLIMSIPCHYFIIGLTVFLVSQETLFSSFMPHPSPGQGVNFHFIPFL